MARTIVSERAPERDNEIAPNTKAYRVFAPILLTRLGTELAKAHKVDVVPITAEGDISKASAANPITVWFHTEVDDKIVEKVLKGHDTTPLSEEVRWEGIMFKANNDMPFSPSDVNLILRRYVLDLGK